MPGDVKVVFYAERVQRLGDRVAQRVATALGSEYTNEVKKLMRDSPASGRQYGPHQASAPGEPPAPDSGNLVGSVGPPIIRRTRLGWVAEVGSNLRKALYLEFGAAKGTKDSTGRISGVEWILFPRPAWGPAMRTIRRRARGIIALARAGKRVS